ncbi:MAG: type I glyceraldehyde-3-phosphate dehydrogenase, partial [Marinirhabdus sp.]
MAEKITVGINGFGRIGRRLFRLLYGHPKVAVVAINDIATAKTLSHLLKYDSIHGILGQRVSAVENAITVGNENYRFTSTKKIEKIDWGKLDVVVECSGKYKTRGELAHHVRNGAKRVILSVPPAKDDIKTIVLGVNDHTLSTGDTIVSNASCTTNNAAPMLKTLAGLCGIKEAYITTVHSYTTDQSLHDQPHPDLRRARAAGQSIVPTTTGAAKALTKIFPHLANNIGGCGIRVPVANGSLT